jgi:hypothetical protein
MQVKVGCYLLHVYGNDVFKSGMCGKLVTAELGSSVANYNNWASVAEYFYFGRTMWGSNSVYD